MKKYVLTTKEWVAVIALGLLFFAASVWSARYGETLALLLGDTGRFVGAFVYFLLTIIAVVIAPISTFPLLPIAVSLWGPFLTATLSITGWTLGSVIAFLLARRYGKPIVRRFADISEVERLAGLLPKEHMFFTLIALRVAVPVDIFSYAVGLFVPVSLTVFTLSTLVGVSPFAFIFSYAVTKSLWYQVGAVVLSVFAVWGAYQGIKKYKTQTAQNPNKT